MKLPFDHTTARECADAIETIAGTIELTESDRVCFARCVAAVRGMAEELRVAITERPCKVYSGRGKLDTFP